MTTWIVPARHFSNVYDDMALRLQFLRPRSVGRGVSEGRTIAVEFQAGRPKFDCRSVLTHSALGAKFPEAGRLDCLLG